jgi:methylated-DNA-protein-cysteine methyltransferase-like protein
VASYQKIYAIVQQIPYGQVATYGQVAELAGLPRRARLVGYALFRVAPEMDVPWHRVINAKGEISMSPFREGNDYLQRSLLEDEGVEFNQHGKVDLRQYLWQPDEMLLTIEEDEN